MKDWSTQRSQLKRNIMNNDTGKIENKIDYKFTAICIFFVIVTLNNLSINNSLSNVSTDISILKQRIQWIESDVTDIKSIVKWRS